MIVGLDLLWVKPQVNGGGESYIRNLLEGFKKYTPDNISFVLFLAKDNYNTFEKYFNNKIFRIVICGINSNSSYKRIIWENLNLNRFALRYNIDLMFVPVYSKPLYRTSKCKYIITIHDLQAMHFPEYFSVVKNLWLRFSWVKCAKTSDRIIAISNFVKHDVENKLNIDSKKISVIYNPVINLNRSIEFEALQKKYGIKKSQYFYTVSSMLKHKNLVTLLYVIKNIRDSNMNLPTSLVISGVGGNSKTEILQLIKKLHIEKDIILTGFISNQERDCLYRNAKVFLFPSIFEGFGMPPVEAMMAGTPVVACSLEVIREVTEKKAFYVEKYFDIEEWIEKIKLACNASIENSFSDKYSLKKITEEYMDMFTDLFCNG